MRSQVTVEEIMTPTAYLDLFLCSISEPTLLELVLRFILLHHHENVLILDTLTSWINTPFRLCVVSLALFRTLIGLRDAPATLKMTTSIDWICVHRVPLRNFIGRASTEQQMGSS
ncbi:FHF complex subunit HOOK-interacting protein 1A-like [Dipodomys merriami]|uniref:FHF complex subunit HOOK-interacting protein 1A-like n=1 Tax=Dipodomys merriami TaxID=94247 RepID=UPI00384A74BF